MQRRISRRYTVFSKAIFARLDAMRNVNSVAVPAPYWVSSAALPIITWRHHRRQIGHNVQLARRISKCHSRSCMGLITSFCRTTRLATAGFRSYVTMYYLLASFSEEFLKFGSWLIIPEATFGAGFQNGETNKKKILPSTKNVRGF